ncbi:MAG: hypothetical protein RBT68_15185, partial [Spirochaetia bacterium]|nr:hypothetical protein [Spirochaetia bacterium]
GGYLAMLNSEPAESSAPALPETTAEKAPRGSRSSGMVDAAPRKSGAKPGPKAKAKPGPKPRKRDEGGIREL